MLHGVTSFHDEHTPTCALPPSSSVIPMARNMARAGARSFPSVTSSRRGLIRSGMAQNLRAWGLHDGTEDRLEVRFVDRFGYLLHRRDRRREQPQERGGLPDGRDPESRANADRGSERAAEEPTERERAPDHEADAR